MNITFLTTSFPRFHGDFAGAFVWHWAKGFCDNGNSVSVVAPDDEAALTEPEDRDIQISRFRYFWPLSFQSFAYGAGVISRIRKNPLRLVQAPFFMLSFFLQAIKKANETDVYFSFWFPSACIGAAVKYFTGKPIIARLSGSDLIFIQSPLTSFLVKTVLKRTLLVVCQDNKFRSALIQLGVAEDKIFCIKNGLDASLFRPIPKEEARKHLRLDMDKLYILTVGRLSKSKGHSLLIEAFNRLSKNNERLHLIIAGEGEERQSLEKAISSLNLSDRISLAGFQKNDTIPHWLNSADIFILPSLLEGTPNIMLEAMACGLPVISTKVGGVEEAITNEQNGCLIKANSTQEIESAMSRLLKEPELRYKLGEAAQETISNQFASWDRQAMTLEKKIKGALRMN